MPRNLLLLVAALGLLGCAREPDLVVYCSLDQDFAEPLIREFERETGLRVDAQFDVERNKTVGLVQRILAERDHPRADVFWNNELAHTIRLKRAGATAAHDSPTGRTLPEAFRDPEGHWYAFAARARVVLYRTDRDDPHPRRLDEMLEPTMAARGGLAKPLTGTTLTNFAVLAELRGRDAALDWLRRALDSGLTWGSGNADVMRKVAEGRLSWCFTDTDDAARAIDAGHPVAVEWLDQGPPGEGVLLIPNSICVLAGAPHPDAAARFLDWVLRPEVEARLARSASRQLPVRPAVAPPPGYGRPGRGFPVLSGFDWERVAASLEDRESDFRALFVR